MRSSGTFKRTSKRASPAPPAATPPPDAAQVNQVFKWVLSGATEHDIREAIAQAWPDAAAAPLIVAAIGRLREAGQVDRQTVRGWCFEATRDLYRRMVEIGDFPGALRAVRQLADLTRD